jgi:predicted nuclease of predicted toxin-antitoxin system
LKFKVDENLPTEYASILRGAGFEADTVSDEKLSGASDSKLSERCCTEDRVLMTLDLDFAVSDHLNLLFFEHSPEK